MFLSAYRMGVLDIHNLPPHVRSDTDHYYYNAISPIPVAALTIEETVYLRPAVLLHILTNRITKPCIIKTHSAHIRVNDVALIPQDKTEGSVYLVRDPRDVVCSFAKHTGRTIDETIERLNLQNNALKLNEGCPIHTWLTTWSNHVGSWGNVDKVRMLRYEDIKAHPVDAFTRILKALDMDVDTTRVRKAIKLCSLARLKRQENKEKFIECAQQERFFGQGRGWQNELTEAQVRQIEQDHGDVMTQLGYDLVY
jgi:hypothetical protein